VEKDYWMPFTFPANLAKLPAASLPCGMTKDGLPIGVQIIGNYLQDLTVMKVSYSLEQVLGFKSYLMHRG
jgi:aspartyl-tRNA(Asn)/glutamyl-tRNA(Gln) amidotransferase subunit A